MRRKGSETFRRKVTQLVQPMHDRHTHVDTSAQPPRHHARFQTRSMSIRSAGMRPLGSQEAIFLAANFPMAKPRSNKQDNSRRHAASIVLLLVLSQSTILPR